MQRVTKNETRSRRQPVRAKNEVGDQHDMGTMPRRDPYVNRPAVRRGRGGRR